MIAWALLLLCALIGGGAGRQHNSLGSSLVPNTVFYQQSGSVLSVLAPGAQLNGTELRTTSAGSSLACSAACLELAQCSHFNYRECAAQVRLRRSREQARHPPAAAAALPGIPARARNRPPLQNCTDDCTLYALGCGSVVPLVSQTAELSPLERTAGARGRRTSDT